MQKIQYWSLKKNKAQCLIWLWAFKEVYINLLDAREPKFNLSSNNVEPNIIKKENYNKKIVNVSEEEIKNHKNFLKNELKKNFYWTFLIL